MSEWKTYKLGEFAEINPRVSLKQGYEYSFVEMKDLDATFKYVSPSVRRELKGGSKFQNGDTLFARITPCLENGKICQVRNLENNVGFGSTEFLVFRGKENVSDNDFVYYLSRSEFVKNNAIQMMTGTSGRQRVEKSALEQLEISVPDLPTQKEIAQILTSLDDKIEINLQMNQTLEAMAQAIFKEWFVNFNFPGFDGELVDGLPKGWRNEPMDENIEFLNGLALQKFPPLNEDEFLPVIKIRELKQGFTNASDKASTELPEKYVIYDGDILFSWSGSLEVVLWCEGKGALNQHLFKVSSTVYPKWFYFFWVREYLPLYKSIAEGKATTMGHIQRRHLTDTIINVPNKELMILADSILSPILDKIQENKIQIQTLTQTRDTLLPKLMSGKISLNRD
jgi:type I restriction enzyme S subunit